MLGLINASELRRYVNQRKKDFVLAMIALVGVLTTSVLVGIAFAALMSIVMLLYRASQPAIATLGQFTGTPDVFGDVTRHPDAQAVPGMLTLRLDAPLYYFNANAVETQVLDLIDRTDPGPSTVVLDIGATSELDVTTADMLLELVGALRERGMELWLAQARGPVRDRMRIVGLVDELGQDHILLTLPAAVAAAAARNATGTGEDRTPS